MSCAGSYSRAEEAKLIESIYSGDFSKFADPKPKNLKKLLNTDPAAPYYAGLYALSLSKNDALTYFEYAEKNSPQPYTELASEELYKLLPNEKKIEKLKQALSDKNTSQEKSNWAKAELNRFLFLSERFEEMDTSVYEYLSEQKFTAEIAESIQKLKKNPALHLSEEYFNILEARRLTFSANFKEAWLIFRPFLEREVGTSDLEQKSELSGLETVSLSDMGRPPLSDMGRAALSGSSDYNLDAVLFENLLTLFEKKSKKDSDYKIQKYMYAFYAARMRLKIGGKENVERAILLFKKAQNYFPASYDYDVALWYILDIEKKRSFQTFVDLLCASTPSWKNPWVYEDFTAEACMKLVLKQDWHSLEKLQKALQKTDLISAQIRLAYILARSKSEVSKIVDSKNGSFQILSEESKKLYAEVYEKDHNAFYYRIMAAYQLQKPLTIASSAKKYTRITSSKFSNEDSIKVLKGLVKYKLYSQLYKGIAYIYPQISPKEALFFSQAAAENGYYADSMKIMTFAVNSEGAEFDEAHLKLIYPRPWVESVKKYAAEYNLPEYLLYALLRSESYFKPEVISHAGAVGLAQLMKPTAADIARRLKLKNYDLNDPDTNIRFGAFYLSDMIRRNNGNIMYALFSYNAGPNAVKRWIKQSGDLPIDLFLESLAYPETRGYGRNVLSAAVIYAYLYYNKDYKEIVKELF